MGLRFHDAKTVLEIGIAGDKDTQGCPCPGANREFFPGALYRTADIDPKEHPDFVLNIELPGQIVGRLLPPPVDGLQEFDVVICSQTLEHTWDIRAAAKSLNLLTKRGGYCLVDVPFNAMPHYGGAECGDWWRLTPQALRRLMEEAGFAVESTHEQYDAPELLSWVAVVCRKPS